MKKLRQITDYRGRIVDGLEQSDYIDMVSISASASKTINIPAGVTWAMFKSTGDFICRIEDACPASGNISDGTAGEVNPTVRWLKKSNTEFYTKINFYAIKDCVISIAYYNE